MRQKFFFAVRKALDSLYNCGEISFNHNTYSGKIGIIYSGGHEGFGGMAEGVGSVMFYHSEKVTGYSNYSPAIVLCGIANHAHEYGHAIGISHQAAGAYDIMHWGGLGKRTNQFCPPHVNPFLKLERNWLTSVDTIRITGTRTLSLPAITSNQPKIALVTIYGDAGKNSDWLHSEYYIMEYRKREKFNRFSGGVNASFGSDSGGVLIWNYSAYSPYRTDGQYVGGGTSNLFSLKVPDYGSSFRGNPGSPSHFYYSSHNIIDSSTTPSSKANSTLTTGIALSNFSVSNNQMNITANYTLGNVPVWDGFIVSNLYSGTLSGKIFVHSGSLNNYTINPGTELHFGPNAGIFLSGVTVNGSSGQILFRGTGYGNTREQWFAIYMNVNHLNNTLNSCKIENAAYAIYSTQAQNIHTIQNCTFLNNGFDIYLDGASEAGSIFYKFPLLTNNSFSSLFITSGSKYEVGSNVTVSIPNSATATISQGVELHFGTNSAIVSHGKILASGLSSENVKFTSSSPNGTWGGITLAGAGANNSELKYVTMKFGTEFKVIGVPSFTLQHSKLENMINGVNAVSASNGWVMDNSITNPRDHGIIATNGSTIAAYRNTITKSGSRSGIGILYNAGSYDYVYYNYISGFSWGVGSIWGSTPTFGHPNNANKNNFIDNCDYGVECYESASVTMGADQPGGIYAYSTFRNGNLVHVDAWNDAYVYAPFNYWGEYPPDNDKFSADNSSSIDNSNPLENDPWEGQSVIVMDDPFKKLSIQKSTKSSIVSISQYNVSPYQSGKKLRKEGRFLECINALKESIQRDEYITPSLLEMYSLCNDTTVSIVEEYFSTLSAQEKPLARYLHGMILSKQKRSDAALAVFSQVPGSSSMSVATKLSEAYIYLYRKGDKAKAEKIVNSIAGERSTNDITVGLALHDIATYVPGEDLDLDYSGKFEKKNKIEIQSAGKFILDQNYPNPFNPVTKISFTIPEPNNVDVKVYDYLGREVTTVFNGYKAEGEYSMDFDASALASGVYFYRLSSGNYTTIRKMLLLK